jgi:predicted HAD superfamily hydrolase
LKKYFWEKDDNLKLCLEREFKVLSCDIFDTLIFRTLSRPEDLFTSVAEEAILRGYLRIGLEPEEFRQMRVMADKAARRVNQTEVDIYEIYDQLPVNIGNKEEILKLELKQEKKHLYLNPSVYSLLTYYHQKGLPIVLLSDMYLKRNQLKELLSSVGFDLNIIDELIVSNDCRKTKYGDGYLYGELINKYPLINPNEILHIGDNYHSDVQNAGKFGIKSIYYKPREDKENIVNLERIRTSMEIPEISSLRKLCCYLSEDTSSKQDQFWYRFGATVMGPLYSIFTEWVIENALQENIKNIYPLMRGGQVMSTFIENSLKEKSVTDISVKPIYISRRSSYLPSLPNINQEFIMNELLSIPWMTVGALFRRVKIKNCFEEFSEYKLPQTREFVLDHGKTLYDEIVAYLCNQENIQKLKGTQLQESELLMNYLNSEFDLTERFITVDIGHAGTIQSSIENIIKKMDGNVQGCHLIAMGNDMTIPKLFKGIDIRGLISNAGVNGEIYHSNNWMPGILDELIRENEGSTVGYKRKADNRIEPILEELQGKEINKDEREICKKGMLEFQKMFLDLLRQKPWVKQGLLQQRKKLYWPILRFMEYPTFEEAKNLGNLFHENFHDEGETLETFCPESLEINVKELGPKEFLRKRRSSLLVWPAGIVGKVYPSYFKHKLLKHSNYSETSKKTMELADFIIDSNLKKVTIYGAGEMGRELVNLLHSFRVEIECIIDRNENLWGQMIEGIKIQSLDEALLLNTSIIVIASAAFYKEIKDEICNKCIKKNIKLNIIDLEKISIKN